MVEQKPVLISASMAIVATLLMISFLSHFVFAYDNAEHEFSIDAPADWLIQEQTAPVIVSFTDSSDTGAIINVVVDSSYGQR